MPNEEFILWADKHRPEVVTMKALLDKPIPADLWELREHLGQVEVWNARMSTMLAEAERMLIDAEEQGLRDLGAGGGPTSERRIHMKFATKQERRVRDVVKGICRAMEYRLMLGMSFMKTLNIEMAASNVAHGNRR